MVSTKIFLSLMTMLILTGCSQDRPHEPRDDTLDNSTNSLTTVQVTAVHPNGGDTLSY